MERKQYEHQRYLKDREKRLEYAKEYRLKNKDKVAKLNKEYQESNKERLAVYRKEYRKTPMGRCSYLVDGYNKQDQEAGREKGDLTAKWVYGSIIFKPCVHCGVIDWTIMGCNRLDNSKSHTKDNVEPCCWDCNNKLGNSGKRKPVCQLALDGELVRVWDCASEAEKEGGFHQRHISECCNGKAKSHKGFKWMFKEDYEKMLAEKPC